MSNIPRDAREVYCDEQGNPIAYCPADSLGATDLERARFFLEQRARLRELAVRAAQKTTQTGERQAVVAIDVDDKRWQGLADALMPDFDWSAIRARGERPVARGVVPHGMCEALVEDYYPAAGQAPAGTCIFVFAAGGIGIFTPES